MHAAVRSVKHRIFTQLFLIQPEWPWLSSSKHTHYNGCVHVHWFYSVGMNPIRSQVLKALFRSALNFATQFKLFTCALHLWSLLMSCWHLKYQKIHIRISEKALYLYSAYVHSVGLKMINDAVRVKGLYDLNIFLFNIYTTHFILIEIWFKLNWIIRGILHEDFRLLTDY